MCADNFDTINSCESNVSAHIQFTRKRRSGDHNLNEWLSGIFRVWRLSFAACLSAGQHRFRPFQSSLFIGFKYQFYVAFYAVFVGDFGRYFLHTILCVCVCAHFMFAFNFYLQIWRFKNLTDSLSKTCLSTSLVVPGHHNIVHPFIPFRPSDYRQTHPVCYRFRFS